MAKFELNVNGKKHQIDVDPSTPILWVLRDNLNLVGTKAFWEVLILKSLIAFLPL